MLISPNLALTTLLPIPNTSIYTPPHRPILCYDSRYAIHQPKLEACSSVIVHQIVTPPFNTRPLNFSTRPASDEEFRVPHTWTDELKKCAVVVAIPELPYRQIKNEESSLLEVKRKALDIVAACVARQTKLGGITMTGKTGHLQVRVEGVDGRGRTVERRG